MHTQALSDRLLPTTDAGLQDTFSCVFQSISWLFPPYEQHMFVHDKRSLCFLRLTDLSIHKQRKTPISWVSAADSYGENHFLPSSCISRVIRITCLQTNYCPNERGHCHQRTLLCHEGGVWGLQQSLGQWYVKDPHARTQGFPAEHWPDHNTAFVILLQSLPQVNDVHAPTIHLI